jgi:DNA polymerase-4
MSAPEARYAGRACEGGVAFVEYREADYSGYAEAYLDVCAEYASAVEPVCQHAAFLNLGLLAGARQLAFALGADLFRSAKLCARIGIAGSRLVSRIAAERCAADAEIVKDSGDAAYIRELPVEYLWQVSSAALSRVRDLGHRTIGEVAQLDPILLRKHFGDEGHLMWDLANGRDRTMVAPPALSAAVVVCKVPLSAARASGCGNRLWRYGARESSRRMPCRTSKAM